MKNRAYQLILINLFLTFFLSACGNGNIPGSYTPPNYEDGVNTIDSTYSEEKKEISLSEAKTNATSFANDNTFYAIPIGCASIQLFDIASSEVYKTEDDYWIIELKGTLYGHDEYGDLVDYYKFEYQVKVDKYTGKTSYNGCNTFKD